jgi:hypothetical protein
MATVLARSALRLGRAAASTLRVRSGTNDASSICRVARLSSSALFFTQRTQPPAEPSHAFEQHPEDAAMSAVRALCVPGRGVLAFEGPSAFCLLQRLTTKNVARLIPSTPQYTMFLTEQVRGCCGRVGVAGPGIALGPWRADGRPLRCPLPRPAVRSHLLLVLVDFANYRALPPSRKKPICPMLQ